MPTATDRLHALVDQITADVPDATVLVASLIISTNSVEEPYRPAYNQAVPGIVQAEQAAGKHVGYVDMSALTADDLSDALHPNDGGYVKMATAFDSGVQAAASAGWLKAPVAMASQVTSGIAGKCLDDNGGSNADGTAVQLWDCDGSGAQLWIGVPRRLAAGRGQVPGRHANGTDNGTKLEIWDCNGGRTSSGSRTTAATATRCPAAASTIRPRPRPTAPSCSCGTATGRTRSGGLPFLLVSARGTSCP